MTILTVQFDTPDRQTYEKLLGAFHRSVRQHMPDVHLEVLRLEAPARDKGVQYGFLANTVKLRAWNEYLETATDDTIFADCDMIALQGAKHAFDTPFDVAYTRRAPGDRVPINNGILMVRPNERSRRFFKMWLDVNDKMYYTDKELHAQWKKKYPGMNQAAFGYMLEVADHGAHLHEYSTREWNAVECDWAHIEPKTVFVHFKGQLRRKVFAGHAPLGTYGGIMQAWYDYAGVPIDKVFKRNGKQSHSAKVRRALNKHRRAVGVRIKRPEPVERAV